MKKLGWKELERINGSSPTRLPVLAILCTFRLRRILPKELRKIETKIQTLQRGTYQLS